MSFYGQIHKQWIGTGLLSSKTESFIFLEVVRCSEYWIPIAAFNQRFENRNKIQGFM